MKIHALSHSMSRSWFTNDPRVRLSYLENNWRIWMINQTHNTASLVAWRPLLKGLWRQQLSCVRDTRSRRTRIRAYHSCTTLSSDLKWIKNLIDIWLGSKKAALKLRNDRQILFIVIIGSIFWRSDIDEIVLKSGQFCVGPRSSLTRCVKFFSLCKIHFHILSYSFITAWQ